MLQSIKSPYTGTLNISPECQEDIWIIDTDCGVDDAQAVFLCLKYCNVQAFIATSGNTPRHNVINNLQKCLKIANKTVPIWLGAEKPMLRQPMYIPEIHGKDGLGDAKEYQQMENLPKQTVCNDQNGIQKLTEFIKKNPNRVHYIVIGPLTTIATAILFDRSVAQKLKAFYSMGGSYKGQGNMAPQRPSVEYNFGADPIATRICVEQIPKTVLCTWQLAREFNHGGSEYQSLIFDQNNEVCKFFKAINGIFLRPQSESGGNFQFCDGLCAVVAICPDAVEQRKSVFGQIDSDSEKCSGALLCDWYGMCKKDPNIEIIVKINELKAFTLLERALKTLSDEQAL